jgi:chemotaxis protein histidine kinase CheA
MSMADEMRGTLNQMGSDVKQVGSQIYGASSRFGDYVGSMLPGAKPGNSGYGNAPAVSAYGAAPPQGPMGTGIPGPGQDPAAYGAAPPQGPQQPAAPAQPVIPPFTPSPEMQQFLTDNNIKSEADLGNLTEQQQLQFDELYEKQQQQPAAPASKPSTYAYGMGPASASAQTAPQTQQQAPAATPTQPPEQQQNVPNSVKAWGGSLPEQATPEQREQADQAEQQLKDLPPKTQQKLQAAASNPSSPEAQEVKADGANNYVTESAADPNNPPPKDPRGYGEWAQGKLSEFGQLDPMAQLAIGAGLSIGVVSMLSSMMGGGGMGGMLLGALGLGAAGLVGASTGMLGNDAKGWVNDAFSGLVTAFGGNVPNEADIRARLETAAKQGPEAAKAELEKVRGEVKPYAAFSQDAGKFLTDSANPNFMYDQAQNYGRDNYAKLVDQDLNGPNRSWAGWAGSQLGLTGEAAKQEGTWSRYFIGDPEKNVADRLARGGWEKQQSVTVMSKVARCWAGYEPVPGKKPYSNNSCRPKSKTKKKPEKKADASCIAVMRKAARCWAGYEPVPGAKAYSEGSCRPKGSKKTKKEVIQGKNHSPAK